MIRSFWSWSVMRKTSAKGLSSRNRAGPSLGRETWCLWKRALRRTRESKNCWCWQQGRGWGWWGSKMPTGSTGERFTAISTFVGNGLLHRWYCCLSCWWWSCPRSSDGACLLIDIGYQSRDCFLIVSEDGHSSSSSKYKTLNEQVCFMTAIHPLLLRLYYRLVNMGRFEEFFFIER